MPRPDYIARLHTAKYDLRSCEPAQRPEMLARYRQARDEAALQSKLRAELIEAAVARDYWEWVKQERLPRIGHRPGK